MTSQNNPEFGNNSFTSPSHLIHLSSIRAIPLLLRQPLDGQVKLALLLNLANAKALIFTILIILIRRIVVWNKRWSNTTKILERQHGCEEPAHLKTHWFFGIDKLLAVFAASKESRVLRYYQSLVAEAGNTFEWTMLGSRVWGTHDSENIKAVLSTKERFFSHEVRREVLGALIGDAIFTQDGSAWRHSRALLKPSFFQEHCNNSALFQENVNNLIIRISCNSVIHLQPLFFSLTLDITTAFIFGKSVYCLTPSQTQEEAEFSREFQYAQVYLSKRYQLGRLCWLFNGQEFRKARPMLQSTDENTSAQGLLGESIFDANDPVQARAHLMHPLLAGRETTACLLTWTMRLLARYQEVQLRVREEISAIFGSAAIDVHKTKDMTYLNCVLKEVLRLYPSVLVNLTTAAEDVVLPTGGGEDGRSAVLVRKGEDVAVCVYSLHRRTDLYGPDAEVFRPERWQDGALDHVEKSYGYLPFHGGRRVCPGRQFALAEASYTVVRLLTAFPNLTLPTETVFPEIGREKQILGLTLASGDGCCIRMS